MFAFNFAAAVRNYSCIIVCIRILSLENIEPKLNQSESVLQYLSHFCASDIEIASQARLFGPVFTGLINVFHSARSIALSWQRALVLTIFRKHAFNHQCEFKFFIFVGVHMSRSNLTIVHSTSRKR